MHKSVAMDSPTRVESTTISPFYNASDNNTKTQNSTDKENDDKTHSTVYQAGFNFVNSIVGAGIIGKNIYIYLYLYYI